ncbi:uncharacterized protein J3D65DRAFT_77278 [Phyllosticta citribraziliensis]|uniref:Uncharacterized protein n=1 Tax=Phyllosticta citribraziliensis TaxID=989973 RepID=A0ABR1LDH4_9PEZI
MSLGTKKLLLALLFASSTAASPVPQLGPKLHFPRFANTSTSNPHASISTPQSVITTNAVQSVHAADTGIPFVVPVTLLTSDGSIIQDIITSPIISSVTPPSTPEPSTSTFFSRHQFPASHQLPPRHRIRHCKRLRHMPRELPRDSSHPANSLRTTQYQALKAPHRAMPRHRHLANFLRL